MWAYQSNRSGLYIYDQLSINIGTAYVATTLSINLLVTSLIITRLLLYRKEVSKTLPAYHTKQYLSVAAIVVESALLYSIFSLAFIITYALHNPMNRVFVYMGSACQQIAGYMIVLRVAQGRAWTSNTLTLGTVSANIRFNPPVSTSHGDIELQLAHPGDKDSSTIETKLNVGHPI
ncbi:hypothetical protein AX14_009497 [Amanita brunnescens Koide BX004]|nr:hypothetical protein AX14_009497 [Amanita brunnescens Koide BX004]